MSQPLLISLSNNLPNIDAYLVGIVHIHASCIHYDKTEATFLPPLEYSKMMKWWKGNLDQTIGGHRHIWVELHPITSRKAKLDSPFQDHELKTITIDDQPAVEYEVGGLVSLSKPMSETGAFRGLVEKLLVSPNHRQKGIAKRLMAKLERVALEEGRTNLMLDTEFGSPAESVYPKLGYIRVGVVPEYGYSPVKGKLCDEVWFYKDLRKGTL